MILILRKPRKIISHVQFSQQSGIELGLKTKKENRKRKTECTDYRKQNTENLSRSVFTTIGNRIGFSLSLKPALQRDRSSNRQQKTTQRKQHQQQIND